MINCEIGLEEDSMDKNDISSEINAWTEANHQNMTKQRLLRYSCIFNNEDAKPERTKVVKHFINTGDARSIRQAPRSVPLAKRCKPDHT